MRKRTRVALWVAGGLAAVLLIAAGTSLWWWRGTLPRRDGDARLPGLSARAAVLWDERGTPTIKAAGLDDALRALGYVHGLLRPFQVELRRRAARGELAAAFGAAFVEEDEEARRDARVERAKDDVRALDAEARRALEAYVGGLNAGLAEAGRRRPPELRAAGIQARPWTAEDVAAFGRLFAGTMSDGEEMERARWDLLLAFGVEGTQRLWAAAYGEPLPPVPEGTRALLAAAHAAPRAAAAAVDEDDLARASNAWIVAPARGTTGGAILAGDPHLGVEWPSVWLEARLEWPGGTLAGATLAGAPGVMIGHNERVAWTFTVAPFDDADLFVVEVDDVEAPTRYRENGAWKRFELVPASIVVAGEKAPRPFVVRRAGPAVYVGPSGLAGRGLLQRWTARERGGVIDAFFAIDRARDVASAVAGARRYENAGFNFLCADAAGAVAHAVVGAAPARRGEGWDGRIPAPWTGEGAWEGLVPREAMPLAVDPAGGTLVSANDGSIAAAPTDPAQRALVGDYDAGFRARRIAERLAALPKVSPADMQAIQRDVRAGSAADLQGLVKGCALDSPAARLYLAWDGELRGAGAPLLHELFRARLHERIRRSTRLGLEGGAWFARTRCLRGLFAAAQDDQYIAGLLDNPATSWDEQPCDHVRAALDAAWDDARTRLGGDPALWTYTAAHVLAPRSPIGVGPLARLFNPPAAGVEGSGDAPNAMAAPLPRDGWSGAPLAVTHGPSYRLVAAFDGAGRIRSFSGLPGGADEHPASKHAADRLAAFARGEGAELWPAPPAGTTTTLEP